MPTYKILSLNLLLLSYTTALAQSYYVCQSCSNANDLNAGTLAAPWKTIGRACQTGAVPAGSTVYIRAGTYIEKLIINVSGTVGTPITFRPYNSDQVLIDGNYSAGVLLTIQNRSHITIDGLTFRNAVGSNSDAIQITGNAQHITLQNCSIYNIAFDGSLTTPTNSSLHNAHGILVKGDDPNNPISNLLIQGNTLNQIMPGYSEGLTLVGNIAGFQILNNTITNVANIGLVVAGYYDWACPTCPLTATTQNQTRQGIIAQNRVSSCRGPLAFAAGIYADGSKDLIIEGNLVTDCQRGIQINCENPKQIVGASASNVTVRNNLIYRNSRAGLGLGSHSYSTNYGKVANCSIVNNSLFDNYINRPEAGAAIEDFGEITLSYSENCRVENNIFHAGSRDRLLNSYDTPNSVNLTVNYNLWYTTSSNPFWVLFSAVYYGFNTFRSSTGQETNGVFGNPAYQSTTAPLNLSITSASAAINSGNPSATTALVGATDYAQTSRIRAGRVDAGAYEFPKPVTSIVATGSWHTASSWDCNCIPTMADVVTIQPGHVVSVTNNNLATAQQLVLKGRLQFQNTGKLQIK
ncbi:right-handed parallel beta-helix repeat-containing protein [Spirosoma sp. SC4-14]|uniref:right-handed parallel beta-helix repeat-containing protein n=1 Tax=Spirosoma sp. SC4-14 TaxID=3128900 RepID=UPI0030D5E551